MIDDILQIIAPHHCSGCNKTGTLLCPNCKYDITSEPFLGCVACGGGIGGANGICVTCRVPYSRAWCVGQRRDSLQRLIGNFKFTNARAGYRPLAALLDEQLPILPENTIIVPVPTVNSHIRQRGYDHMALIARRFAKLRGLTYQPVLQRATTTKQRDANKQKRTKQAKTAFAINERLKDTATYLLLDDVVTTGATMKYAAKTLQSAGAGEVWVAAVSHQPLD